MQLSRLLSTFILLAETVSVARSAAQECSNVTDIPWKDGYLAQTKGNYLPENICYGKECEVADCECNCACFGPGCKLPTCKRDCWCEGENCEMPSCEGSACFTKMGQWIDPPVTSNDGQRCDKGGCDMSTCTRDCSCDGGCCDMSNCKQNCFCNGGNCNMKTCVKQCGCAMGQCDTSSYFAGFYSCKDVSDSLWLGECHEGAGGTDQACLREVARAKDGIGRMVRSIVGGVLAVIVCVVGGIFAFRWMRRRKAAKAAEINNAEKIAFPVTEPQAVEDQKI